MSAAREEILARIRGVLGEQRAPVEIPRGYTRSREPADLLGHFTERVEDYRAVVDRVTPDRLPAAVAEACTRYGVRSVVVPADVPDDWLSALRGVTVVQDRDSLAPTDLDQVDAVLTGAAVGVAETGTIVLDSGPRQGRRAVTLVPDVHLCVVEAGQVVDDVPAAVSRLDPRRPLTWISGPSATSDIELDRVEGVHGPRTLHVLLVAEPDPPGAAPDPLVPGPDPDRLVDGTDR
ncbi:LutC/YkgG family protein [Actinoplanes sp. URMC 104]|uniref:LutC/YkgG family protein n=1 Tax=Actinoplanes sp. URMC 104 TaxID=3423409 RepID=UPI003F19E95F